ncbi:Uncharacterized protein GBIM_08869 [Gryllus bimaculatus]|nr:Uncharacterized protein GBIM_08869 [Gryllus bimaculatus]
MAPRGEERLLKGNATNVRYSPASASAAAAGVGERQRSTGGGARQEKDSPARPPSSAAGWWPPLGCWLRLSLRRILLLRSFFPLRGSRRRGQPWRGIGSGGDRRAAAATHRRRLRRLRIRGGAGGGSGGRPSALERLRFSAAAPRRFSEAAPVAFSAAVPRRLRRRREAAPGGAHPSRSTLRARFRAPEPEEPAPIRPIRPHAPAQSTTRSSYQRHFAPSHRIPSSPPSFQDEQKTLIYVLSRSRDAPEINIPTRLPSAPSKPRCTSSRYKTAEWRLLPVAPSRAATRGGMVEHRGPASVEASPRQSVEDSAEELVEDSRPAPGLGAWRARADWQFERHAAARPARRRHRRGMRRGSGVGVTGGGGGVSSSYGVPGRTGGPY